jgi:hypothetical protein
MLDPEQPVLKPLPPGMRGDDIGRAAEVAASGEELPGVGLRDLVRIVSALAPVAVGADDIAGTRRVKDAQRRSSSRLTP